jgi:hypothetical protein
MKAQELRTHVAALMLLAPVAATLVAQPAFAQQRAAVAQPSISTMSINADAGLSPGSTLRIQVTATPNASRATLALGDGGVVVPLQQQAAGTYTGSYVVRRADRLDPLQLMTARLTFGERTYSRQFNYPAGFQSQAMGAAPAAAGARADNNRREPERQARDERSPRIEDLTPSNGERVRERGRTHIAARIFDEGSGIDPNTARVRLNGRDVTDEARITAEEIHFRGDLGPGAYKVEVSVKDQAGNATTKSWNFEVVAGEDRRGEERRGEAPRGVPLQLTSHADNTFIDGRGNLLLQGRTLPGATVRVQVESVANVGGLLGVTQPVADATVQADRNGVFSVGVQPRSLPIPGMRYDIRMTATSGGQSSEERLTLIQRQG